jgi:hypothetical protein
MNTTRRSDQIEELIAALVKAQGEFQPLKKTNTATVHSKRTGATHSYNYASLPDVNEACDPALRANGLAVIQTTEARVSEGVFEHVLVTTLYHVTGQFVEGEMPIPMDVSPHEIGSWMTYLRRYAKCAIIGVAAEEDDDAGAAQGGHGDRGSSGGGGGRRPSGGGGGGADRSSQIANPFAGKVADIQTFQGENQRGPWTRYHITVEGADGNGYEFRTFSDTQGDIANSAKRDGRAVVIGFEKDQYGRKITSLDLADNLQAQADADQQADGYANDDDVPF